MADNGLRDGKKILEVPCLQTVNDQVLLFFVQTLKGGHQHWMTLHLSWNIIQCHIYNAGLMWFYDLGIGLLTWTPDFFDNKRQSSRLILWRKFQGRCFMWFYVVLCGFMWFINVAECGQWAPLATWGCSSLSQWLISTVLFCPFG